MKKIHLLILKSFIRPFLVTFLIVMFVLLMLFLFKYVDDLIGKGFEWYIILELMMYASATNVQMALPLSVLLSSIMTYGSLGENYELVAIKSAGISLRRALYPMFVVIGILSISAFIFSDYMLPIANLKYYSLLYDARQQKSANFLPEGVFSNSFPGYVVRVNKKDPDGQTLHGVMIYSKNAAQNNTDVLIAKEGKMYRTPNGMFLVLKLKDGVRYSEDKGRNNFDYRQRLIRYRFKETEQKFDISSFAFNKHRTDENEFRGALQMMNLSQLKDNEKQNRRQVDSTLRVNYKLITAYIKYYSININPDTARKYRDAVKKDKAFADLKLYEQLAATANASSEARSIQDLLKNRADRTSELSKNVRRARLEFHKKFVLSAGCLALFLIGAPLGAIIRKGGLGLPVVVSVIFFLIYYIISTIGEKAVKDGDLSPIIGSWIAIAVITPVGLFLSYKAATDSVLFDMELYKRFFNKLFKRRKAAA
ncbi:LptF/LptG family permease [Mucilaginibacter sp. L3T2-6]|uniref:LptF/LptG family permease n=1 Tax=Mucilaginibacter sp. L3T2-6 TaxID=3062491 RepID=UPI0026763FF7|nr:LptF/LptG family permease [Mucilaginibacter sp. L3T2-6]MDO3641227.1 LptF/LptG family permease [Mucilaginibacter sp. L3T2-6]MDV6214014.1 LptF/LptG family permease [Mucilaginibacter sp. L3T2-6]